MPPQNDLQGYAFKGGDFAIEVFRVVVQLEREVGHPLSAPDIRARLRLKFNMPRPSSCYQIRLLCHRGLLLLSPGDHRYRTCDAAARLYLEEEFGGPQP